MGVYKDVDDKAKAIGRRLARIEGQVRGLRRMVEEDEYCCDVLTQLAAARSALDQVGAELVTRHVRQCVLELGPGEPHAHAKPMSREELLDELGETISRLVR